MRGASSDRVISSLVAIWGISGIILFSGCATSSTAMQSTPVTTNTSAGSVVSTYTSNAKSYTISHFVNWSILAISNSVAPDAIAFKSPDQRDTIAVIPLTTKVSANNYGNQVKGFLTNIGGSSIALSGTMSTVTFPTGSWTVVQGTMMINGTPDILAIYGQDHGSGTYLLVSFGPAGTVDTDNSQYFMPIRNSFKFLK
jgi:hypothetical protein